MTRNEQLADILREEELLGEVALDEAVRVARDAGVPLACYLLDSGAIEEEDLFFLLSRRGVAPAIPRDHLMQAEIDPELKQRVPAAVAHRFGVLPMEIDARVGRLAVAMVDPADRDTVERLRRAVGVEEVRSYLARYSTISAAIERAYASHGESSFQSRSTGEIERGDTQVELIPGKVSLDPSLFKEMEAISPVMAKDSRKARSARPTPMAPERRARPAMPADRRPVVKVPERQPPSERRAAPVRSAGQGRRQSEQTRPKIDDSVTRVRRVPTPAAPPNAARRIVEVERLATRKQDVPQARMPELPAAAVNDSDKTNLVRAAMGSIPEPSTQRPTWAVDGRWAEALEAAFAILVSIVEERVEAGSAVSSEFAYLTRFTAIEAGLAEQAVRGAYVVGQLMGLETVLRREVDLEPSTDVAMTFAEAAEVGVVLNPGLRALGRLAISLGDGASSAKEGPPVVLRVARLVADFLALRSSDVDADLDTIFQLLRTGGADAFLMDALERAVQKSEGAHDTEPRSRG